MKRYIVLDADRYYIQTLFMQNAHHLTVSLNYVIDLYFVLFLEWLGLILS